MTITTDSSYHNVERVEVQRKKVNHKLSTLDIRLYDDNGREHRLIAFSVDGKGPRMIVLEDED